MGVEGHRFRGPVGWVVGFVCVSLRIGRHKKMII